MKYFFISLLLLFSASLCSQEIIPIETPLGTKEVIIPETKNDLKENYLLLAGMYFSQKYDLGLLQKSIDLLQKSLIETNTLLSDITSRYDILNKDKYQPLVIEYGVLEGKHIDLTKEYNEVVKKYNGLLDFKDPLQNYLFASFGYQLNGFEIKAGYQMILFEKFSLGVYTGYPLSINLVAGIRF
jgi:hypothetical protein